MSHSGPIPVQNNIPDQPIEQAKSREIDILVKSLEKLHNSEEGIKLVLNAYCNFINEIVNLDEKTNLIMWSIEKGHDLCLKQLLKVNINKNHLDIYGNNALTYAASLKKFTIVQKLIDHGFDINHVNYDGDTVLSLTIQKGNSTEALNFLKQGIVLNRNDENAIEHLDKRIERAITKQDDIKETNEGKTEKNNYLIRLLTLKNYFTMCNKK